MEKLFERASINDDKHVELALHVTYVLSIITLACFACTCVLTCCLSWCTPVSLRKFLCGITCVLLLVLLVATIVTTDVIETSAARAQRLEHKAEKLYKFLDTDD